MAVFDAWGGSWGTSWLTSWFREPPVPVVPTLDRTIFIESRSRTININSGSRTIHIK